MQFIIKTIISAIIIATVSVLSKKSPLLGGITVSLPLTSIIAIIWFYVDTKNIEKVVSLSNSISLMVIPSIIFFIALSFLLKNNMKFYLSMILSSMIMILTYSLYTFILNKIGVNL